MIPGQVTKQDEDRSHLKTLGTATLVYAGLLAVATAITFFYILIGAVAVVDPSDSDTVWAGGIVVTIGIIVCALLSVKTIILFFSGIGLLKNKWQTISYVGAVLSCMNMPFGTVLAVFTFVVLGRPSVRALYSGRPPTAAPPPPIPTPPKPRTAPPLMRVEPTRWRVATPT